jgi:hypothetical protein
MAYPMPIPSKISAAFFDFKIRKHQPLPEELGVKNGLPHAYPFQDLSGLF